uniref:Ubiquitin-like protease family profile domain-containing protein n=1 Tax=Cucumis melo TaxID=3656 RepID=A0A9I9E9C4_CUCME
MLKTIVDIVDSQDVAPPKEKGESSTQKRKRGPTEMKEITRARSEGQKLVIQYNELGQKKSKNGKKKWKKHKYNHRTSRKGYANLMEELKASSSDQIDRSIVWKQVRMDRKGQIPDEETKEVVNLIDELVSTQNTTNAFGEEDILTRALGGKDRPGILRSVGKYVTKKKYFHTATQQKTNEKEDDKATSKEHDRMAKRIKELEEELLKMKENDDCVGNLKEEPGIGYCPNNSLGFVKLNIAKDDKKVEGVTLEKMKVGTPCKLAFETKDHVIAWGTIIDSDVEGDNVKVAIDVVVDEDCAILIPSEQGMYKISQEVGSHILWPRDLVITNNIKMDYGEFTKDMSTFTPTPIQNASVALWFLLRMVEHMGSAIQITTPHDDFTSMQPIATACLDAYIMYLYTRMESSRTLNLYKFVDAGSISCGSFKEERAQLLTARLLGTDYDKLLLIPYNSGNHWTLVVINLTKGAAFWIDPLKNRIDPDVTEVVERSFNIMNKKKPVWRVVKMKDSPRVYTQDDIDCIRSEWAEFVGKHVLTRQKGILWHSIRFCHNPLEQ